MAETRYLIGEVSRITGISKDTLRFWDKIGLLKPRETDPETGYRYYTYDQFWSLDIISCCRNLNIPIEKIRSILESNSNDRVLSLLLEQQREAEERSRYYSRIVDDIAWYVEQDRLIREASRQNAVTVRRFPPRAVLYGRNPEETHAYHLKLQELCRSAMPYSASIRRGYGFLLDETAMGEGIFRKRGEYIRFDEESFRSVDPRYLTRLPEGRYACCVVNVVNDRADFSTLLRWLEEHRVTPRYVTADEVGLQLFEYLDHGYLCEIQVLLD